MFIGRGEEENKNRRETEVLLLWSARLHAEIDRDSAE